VLLVPIGTSAEFVILVEGYFTQSPKGISDFYSFSRKGPYSPIITQGAPLAGFPSPPLPRGRAFLLP